MISYLKAKLDTKAFFSLPTAVFNRLLKEPGSEDIDYSASEPFSQVIEICKRPPIAFDMAAVRDVTFFEAVNVWPERRHNVTLHHMDSYTDAVIISGRAMMKHDAASQRVVLLSKAFAKDKHCYGSSFEIWSSRLCISTLGSW